MINSNSSCLTCILANTGVVDTLFVQMKLHISQLFCTFTMTLFPDFYFQLRPRGRIKAKSISTKKSGKTRAKSPCGMHSPLKSTQPSTKQGQINLNKGTSQPQLPLIRKFTHQNEKSLYALYFCLVDNYSTHKRNGRSEREAPGNAKNAPITRKNMQRGSVLPPDLTNVSSSDPP